MYTKRINVATNKHTQFICDNLVSASRTLRYQFSHPFTLCLSHSLCIAGASCPHEEWGVYNLQDFVVTSSGADAGGDVLRGHGRTYRKIRGRAFRSNWMCARAGCGAKVVLNELKGGSVVVQLNHSKDCLPEVLSVERVSDLLQ